MENYQKLLDIGTQYGINIIAAVLIFVIGRWISKGIANLITKILKRNKVEKTLTNFIRNIIYYALLIAVIIASLNSLGINTTSFLTVVGAAGLAIGLALKDSLGNFAAGVMLILFKPFKVGDFVNAGGVDGSVKEISLFNTELTSPDNKKIIVPNSAILANVITNVTANPTRRIDLTVGVGYEDNLPKTKEILTDLLKQDSRVLTDPPPTIAVAELGDSSVNFVVRPWVKTDEYWTVRFDLTEKIKQAFDHAEINIPYPQQDVHLYVEKQT